MVIKYSMYICMCVALILHAYAQTYKYLLAFILFNIITTDCGCSKFPRDCNQYTHIYICTYYIYYIVHRSAIKYYDTAKMPCFAYLPYFMYVANNYGSHPL